MPAADRRAALDPGARARDALLLQRVFLAEKWLVTRLHYGHVDPREAGVGNIVNCGAAMYMAPVGIVNAGDPAGAYAEAIEIAGAHQSSYGREAAGVFAAAVAAAMAPGATVDAVVDAALALARDGTRAAIEAVADAARGQHATGATAIRPPARRGRAVRHGRATSYRAPAWAPAGPAACKSIEELPVALGLVVVRRRRLRAAVLGAVNYGRDADSIATHGGRDRRRARRARRGPGRLAASRSPRRAASTWTTAGGDMAEVARRDLRATTPSAAQRPATPRGVATSARDALDLGAAARTCCRTSSRPSADEGCDVDAVDERWAAAGGVVDAPQRRGDRRAGDAELRGARPRSCWTSSTRCRAGELAGDEPDDLAGDRGAWPLAARPRRPACRPRRPAARRVAGPGGRLPARQAGREDPPRGHPGDRRRDRQLAARRLLHRRGLPADVAAALAVEPAQRAPTSLAENIDGMPEDDDLNFALLALRLLEQHGAGFTTDDVGRGVADVAARRAGVHRRAGRLPQPARG